MKTIMLINAVHPEEYRIAFIKDGMLDGFQVETAAAEQKVGNIYKGVIEKVESRLQACFVDFGVEKNGFLSIGDVHPEYYKVDLVGSGGMGRRRSRRFSRKARKCSSRSRRRARAARARA